MEQLSLEHVLDDGAKQGQYASNTFPDFLGGSMQVRIWGILSMKCGHLK